MFPSSVIRKLANSEEMLAETHNFVGLAAHVEGPIDIDACRMPLTRCSKHTRSSPPASSVGADGRHQFVTDDLSALGNRGGGGRWPGRPKVPLSHFDQSESLVHLRLTIRDGQAHPTLYVHHALADGHHMFGLIEELLSYYTDLVCTGSIGPVTAQPTPESIETVLADRGIQKAAALGYRAVHAGAVRLRPSTVPASRHRRQTRFACAWFRWCRAG